MPLIRIDLLAGKPPDYHAALRDTVLIQITLNEGRTADRKRAYYAALAVARPRCIGVRPQDVVVNLIEVAAENWSFGAGRAQYVELAEERERTPTA